MRRDLLASAELAELDPDGSRPLEGMHGLCGRRFDCFDPVCSAAVGVGAVILPSAGIEFLPREDALISQGHSSPLRKRISGPSPCRAGVRVAPKETKRRKKKRSRNCIIDHRAPELHAWF